MIAGKMGGEGEARIEIVVERLRIHTTFDTYDVKIR